MLWTISQLGYSLGGRTIYVVIPDIWVYGYMGISVFHALHNLCGPGMSWFTDMGEVDVERNYPCNIALLYI